MEPVAEQPSEGREGGDAFSPKDLALFAARSARQHLLFCLFVAVTIALIGTMGVSAIPPVYDATCKIFIQDGGSVTTALASGRDHYRPGEGTEGLEELLLARDNLLSIAREAKLVETWPRTRALPMRLKDKLVATLVGPPSRKDMERGFAEMLAVSITGAKDGESVRIHGQWRDKQNAYDITRLAVRNFLAARAAKDLGPIQRAIPFLEQQQLEAEQAIDSAVTRVQNAKGHSGAAAAVDPTPTAPTQAANDSLSALAAVSRQLAQNKREQRELVEPWRRRIAELKVELVDLKASYDDEHALVRQQEARIAAASEVPEDLATLRAKEGELLAALSSRGVSRPAAAAAAAKPIEISADDPELAPLRARLFAALRKSDELADRLESARVELATAEADFKHRYVVVEEPEVPTKPIKNKKPLLYAVVMLAALLIGALSGSVRELRKGRLTEPWQVQALGLELLGEVDLKKLMPPDKA